ncbi:hypothetical protein BKA66DRAFT_508070 [Pyrenochaeta sp. MPI-SDFR-AT-0127]|nr:hypothetical protein BKA66DRAFT_508070 [Pyrenochaeta sp. MPI-SDFR-AT-0127]
MILTTSFFPPPTQYYPSFTPPRSSPLSERSTNAIPRLFNLNMATNANKEKAQMSQRAYKPNPVLQTRDAATKRRRDMFFRRVQDSRDDKKWAARGDQIQHLDFVSERKRWEAEKAREAPEEEDIIDDEVIEDAMLPDFPAHVLHSEQEMIEVDHIAAQEDYELQQLIASMEQEADATSQHYGSDDEDYESIFMECATTVDQQYQQQSQSAPHEVDAMDMDMTDG